MKTSTQVYRELKAAEFSEPQARALVEILQAGGIVEPERLHGCFGLGIGIESRTRCHFSGVVIVD